MFPFLAIPACAALNRFRGGGLGASALPGHPRFYAAPLMAAIAFLAGTGPVTALGLGACYLIWSLAPWGHLMCLGRVEHEPSRDPAMIEDWCRLAARNNPWVALGILHLLFLLPAVFLTGWAILMPPLIVLAYELSWRHSPEGEIIRNAEVCTGVLWGLLVWVMA